MMEIDPNTIMGAAIGAYVGLKLDIAALKSALEAVKKRVTELEKKLCGNG